MESGRIEARTGLRMMPTFPRYFAVIYAMGRPKGSKNRSTILREAQDTMIARGLTGHEQEFLDSLHVDGSQHAAATRVALHCTTRPTIKSRSMTRGGARGTNGLHLADLTVCARIAVERGRTARACPSRLRG
jgi:hypothetical protein